MKEPFTKRFVLTQKASLSVVIYHVQERIFPLEILMVYEPLDLFFYHLLLWDEHVFKNFDKFCLKGSICYCLSYLHDLNNRLLHEKQSQPDYKSHFH